MIPERDTCVLQDLVGVVPSNEQATCLHRSTPSQTEHYQVIVSIHAVRNLNSHDLRTSGASLHDFGTIIFFINWTHIEDPARTQLLIASAFSRWRPSQSLPVVRGGSQRTTHFARVFFLVFRFAKRSLFSLFTLLKDNPLYRNRVKQRLLCGWCEYSATIFATASLRHYFGLAPGNEYTHLSRTEVERGKKQGDSRLQWTEEDS